LGVAFQIADREGGRLRAGSSILTAGQILNAQATYRSRGRETLATTEFKPAGANTGPPRAEAERWRSWVMETSDGGPDDQTPALLTDRAELFEAARPVRAVSPATISSSPTA
jgi:hypothetical protein